MAKRFTDTEKWRDEWWGSLSNDYRMIWLYLVDSCSIAGIWKKDFRGLNFNCNTNITEDDFLKVFNGRVIDKGSFFFIPKFIRFQNPKGLNSNKPAVLSVVNELQLNNLISIIHELFGNDYLIIKGKVKVKEGIGKVKEGINGYNSEDFYKSGSQAFDSIKNDELLVERLVRIVHQAGYRSCTPVTIMKATKFFLTQEEAKPEFFIKPRDDIKSHLVNWIAKYAKDLDKYG